MVFIMNNFIPYATYVNDTNLSIEEQLRKKKNFLIKWRQKMLDLYSKQINEKYQEEMSNIVWEELQLNNFQLTDEIKQDIIKSNLPTSIS